MIRFVVARYEGDSYESFLKPYVENKYPVFEIFNSDIENSIYTKYNKGIDVCINDGLDDNDIIAFCHGDVKLLDPSFEDKVLYIFDRLPKLGVAGVIGAVELHETAGWWLSDRSLHRGHLMQWVDKHEYNKYHMIRSIGNYNNLAVVDGLCMLVKGELAKKLKFDSTTYPGSYNFYDYDYCLEAKAIGYTVGVFDILLEHGSAGEGIRQDDWKENKNKFVNKWKTKGYTFPIR